MATHQFIQSVVGGLVRCFQFLAGVDKASMNIPLDVFVHIDSHFCCADFPLVQKFLGHRACAGRCPNDT